MDSETGKKAIGEMLDTGFATLKVSPSETNTKGKRGRDKGDNEKTPKPKAKQLTAEEKAKKELQKDIKMLLGLKIHID